MTILERLVEWDGALRAWLTTHHHPFVDVAMVTLSLVGRGGTIWLAIALVLLLLDRRRWRGVAATVVAITLSLTMTDGVVKPLVRRARPYESTIAVRVLDRRPSTYSFPSGHAATAVAGALTLSALWPRARLALWILAALVSLSRIYVGVHYPADVVGGALVGFVCGSASRLVLRLPRDDADRSKTKDRKSKIGNHQSKMARRPPPPA